MTARDEIAAAASTVPGITVSAYADGADSDGSGYVELARDEWPNQFGGETYWEVVILCPDDVVAAQKFYEQSRVPVARALVESRALVVTGTHPELLALAGNQTRKVFVVEGHRETEE